MANEWISVKEGMPENGDRVLLVEYGMVHAGYFQKARTTWIGDIPDIFIPLYADEGSFKNATHWMPLPEPPK